MRRVLVAKTTFGMAVCVCGTRRFAARVAFAVRYARSGRKIVFMVGCRCKMAT